MPGDYHHDIVTTVGFYSSSGCAYMAVIELSIQLNSEFTRFEHSALYETFVHTPGGHVRKGAKVLT